MSDAVFPELPGLTFPVQKSPIYSTTIKTALSGREVRRSNYATPIWLIGLSFEFLRDEIAMAEFKTLASFFQARRGAFDSFLFRDPDDCTVVNEQIGVGDGVTRSFQLARTFGGVTEPVCNIDAASLIISPLMWAVDPNAPMWGNEISPMWSGALDVLPTDYALSTTGLLTFNTAPAAGVPVLASFNYYYRCRFQNDQADFQKFMYRLWDLKKCDLRGSLGTKI